jgi:hypothetical protein
MTYRIRLMMWLLMAGGVTAPTASSAAEGKSMQWLAGSAPATSSAEDAAQLARQAAELAARAAQMAANSQPASATTTNVGAPIASAGQPSPAPAAGWKNSEQGGEILDIRFQKPPVAAAPATAGPGAARNDGRVEPVGDQQVRLVARDFTNIDLVQTAQQEQLTPPATAPQPAPLATNGYNGAVYGDACCPPQRQLFWVSGVEATFLSPDLNNLGATFEIEEISDSRDDWFTSQSNDVDSLYVAPRAWIGVQGCNWGANLRYWHLQAGEGGYDPTISDVHGWDAGYPDAGYFTCSRLEAYTIDLELTRRFCVHDHWMQASFGVRHAEIWHAESITGLADSTDGLLSGFAHADRNTRGTGLVLGLYGRKPVFPCSCVHWFYNFRWSALWGPTETNSETFASVLVADENATATASSINGALTRVDDDLFIGEIQLGLEWNYALQCLPANAFCRFAVEYQRWYGGMGQTGALSFAGVTVDDEFTTLATTSAGAAAPELDLIGFTLGAGLTW